MIRETEAKILKFPKRKKAPRMSAPKPLKHVEFFKGFNDQLIVVARNYAGEVLIEARVPQRLRSVEFMARLEQWVKLLEYTDDALSIDDF